MVKSSNCVYIFFNNFSDFIKKTLPIMLIEFSGTKNVHIKWRSSENDHLHG